MFITCYFLFPKEFKYLSVLKHLNILLIQEKAFWFWAANDYKYSFLGSISYFDVGFTPNLQWKAIKTLIGNK